MATINEQVLIHAPIGRCFDLARSVEVHVLGNIHFGESAVAADGRTSGLIEPGERVAESDEWRRYIA